MGTVKDARIFWEFVIDLSLAPKDIFCQFHETHEMEALLPIMHSKWISIRKNSWNSLFSNSTHFNLRCNYEVTTNDYNYKLLAYCNAGIIIHDSHTTPSFLQTSLGKPITKHIHLLNRTLNFRSTGQILYKWEYELAPLKSWKLCELVCLGRRKWYGEAHQTHDVLISLVKSCVLDGTIDTAVSTKLPWQYWTDNHDFGTYLSDF